MNSNILSELLSCFYVLYKWHLFHVCLSLEEGSLHCGSSWDFLFSLFRVFEFFLNQFKDLRAEDVTTVQSVKAQWDDLWIVILRKTNKILVWLLLRMYSFSIVSTFTLSIFINEYFDFFPVNFCTKRPNQANSDAAKASRAEPLSITWTWICLTHRHWR